MDAVTDQPPAYGGIYGPAYGMSQGSEPSLRMLENLGEFKVKRETGGACGCSLVALRIYDGAGQEVLVGQKSGPARGAVEYTFKDVVGAEVISTKVARSLAGIAVEVECPKGRKIATIEPRRSCCPCSERNLGMNILNAGGTLIYRLYFPYMHPCMSTVDFPLESAETNTDVGTISFQYPRCNIPDLELSVPVKMDTTHKAILLCAMASLIAYR